MENRDSSFKANAPGDGQGIWIFSLTIASALFFNLSSVKEYTEPRVKPIRDQIKTFVMEQFKTASNPPVVAKSDCPLVPISHSPAAMMVMAEKFPDAGCAPRKN